MDLTPRVTEDAPRSHPRTSEHRVKNTLLVAVLVSFAAGACVSNPAKHLTPNDDELSVDGNALKRGDAVIDEQDFYTLTGDEASAAEIEKARAGGETFQAIGIPVAAVGVGLAAVGLVAYYRVLNPEEGAVAGAYDGYIAYGLLFGGLAVTAGGGYLVVDGREAASGSRVIFDANHARASLEKGLYGGGGATAGNIKSLSWATSDGVDTFCSITGKALKPVVAKDEKGRNVRLEGREDWITYTSNPEGLISGGSVRSPWTENLNGLGDDITVTATVKETGVATSLTLKPDFACPSPGFRFGANSGSSGNSGSWGSSGSSGGSGGDGGDGGAGAGGDDGPDVEIEVTTLSFRGKTLVVAALKAQGAKDVDVTVHDVSAGPLYVGIGGGSGGSGGNGGSGGSGGNGSSECVAGGDGGRGGRGGSGGPGGRGGQAKVRFDGDAKELIAVDVGGGNGGSRGNGGSGGSSGNGSRCGDSDMADGRRGPEGPDGQPGNPGTNGKAELTKTPKKSLSMLARPLASAPK